MSDETIGAVTTDTSDVGAATANQPDDSSTAQADVVGATEANQTEATDAGSSTTDTVAESPQISAEDLLKRVDPTASAPVKPAADLATGNPFAHLSPDFQKLLKDPQQATQLENVNKLYGKQAAEVGHLRQQIQSYQGLPPPEHMRSLIEQQKQHAEIAKIRPFMSPHPEHQKSMQRIDNVKKLEELQQLGVPDEQVSAAARRWGVTPDDFKLKQEFESHQADTQRRLATDFHGLLHESVGPMIQAGIQQWEQQRRASIGANQFLEQHQPLLEKHRDAATWAMENQSRSEVALRLVQLEEEVQKLRGSAIKDSETVHAAQARNALTKTRATAATRRDPATNADTIGNVVSRANQMNDKDYLTALMKARGVDQ